VVAFLIVISLFPGAQQLMKITALTASQWGMILIATFIGTFWMEVRKLIAYHRK
jgi:hypothetical protein